MEILRVSTGVVGQLLVMRTVGLGTCASGDKDYSQIKQAQRTTGSPPHTAVEAHGSVGSLRSLIGAVFQSDLQTPGLDCGEECWHLRALVNQYVWSAHLVEPSVIGRKPKNGRVGRWRRGRG